MVPVSALVRGLKSCRGRSRREDQSWRARNNKLLATHLAQSEDLALDDLGALVPRVVCLDLVQLDSRALAVGESNWSKEAQPVSRRSYDLRRTRREVERTIDLGVDRLSVMNFSVFKSDEANEARPGLEEEGQKELGQVGVSSARAPVPQLTAETVDMVALRGRGEWCW